MLARVFIRKIKNPSKLSNAVEAALMCVILITLRYFSIVWRKYLTQSVNGKPVNYRNFCKNSIGKKFIS